MQHSGSLSKDALAAIQIAYENSADVQRVLTSTQDR
jgi:hypothetical protein